MQHRLVFMGTPDFAVPSLEALIAEGWPIDLVVTQPDRPKGRGQKTTASPVKVAAEKAGLPIFQPQKLRTRESYERVAALKPDLLIVVAYGALLGPRFLELPKIAPINVHASLLPKFRGAAPIHWAVSLGERESGVSIMKMELGLDSGPVYHKRKLELAHDESAGSLHDKLAPLGAEALLEALPGICAGQEPQSQDESQVLLSPPLKKAQGALLFNLPAPRLWRRIRGMSPWPGAFCRFRSKNLKIISSALAPADLLPAAPPGTLQVLDNQLFVACSTGWLELIQVQPAGKRALHARDFLHGYQPKPGEVLEDGPGASLWDKAMGLEQP